MKLSKAPVLSEVAQAVFAQLLAAGEATRKILVEETGFSFPSVTVALAELTAKNQVDELRKEQGARGRATIVYGVSLDAGWVLGVDIGSTQISYIARALNSFVLASGSIKRDKSHANPDQCASQLIAQAQMLYELGSAPLAVTIAINQVVPRYLLDPQQPRSLSLDIAKAFVEHCGLPAAIPFLIENNVNCAAVAEQQMGKMRGYEDATYMQIGVGIGLGFFCDSVLIRGGNGYAGELAQIPRSWHRDIDSQPDALEYDYGSEGLMRKAQARFQDTGHLPPISPEDLFLLSAEGNPLAQALVEEHSIALGRIAAAAAAILDPRILVLGGGLSHNTDFTQRIAEEFQKRNQLTQITVSEIGPKATVEGACLLARDYAITQLTSRFYKPICPRPTRYPFYKD